MDKDIFLRGYAGLAVFTGVEVSETALKAAFNLMKDDFGNEEFLRICEDIAKTENLYGRLPIPKLFYDRRKKSAPVSPSKFQMAKMFFLDKCESYLNSDYVPDWEKKDFQANLTSSEMAALKCVGGISACWSAIHRGGAWDGDQMSWKMKELGKAFDGCYQETGDMLMLPNNSNDNEERLVSFDLDNIIRLKRIPQ